MLGAHITTARTQISVKYVNRLKAVGEQLLDLLPLINNHTPLHQIVMMISISLKKYMTQHQSEQTRQTRDVETIPLPLSLMLPQVAIIIMSQMRNNKI